MKNLRPQLLPANKHGFTLIELLVVTALAIMLMLSASAVFMTFLIGSAKTNLSQKVKAEGNQAISQIKFLLRNARSLQPNLAAETCTTDMSSIAFESLDGLVTTLSVTTDPSDSQDKIASSSAENGNYFFTSGQTTFIDTPPIQFDCYLGANNSHYVEVSFTLHQGQGNVTVSDRQNIVETFSTGVTLRN